MAKSHKMNKIVKKMVETEVSETTYHFEFTIDELKTLRAILNRVGGSPKVSPRQHADAISDAIDGVMGRSKYDWEWAQEIVALVTGGGITFLDYGKGSE